MNYIRCLAMAGGLALLPAFGAQAAPLSGANSSALVAEPAVTKVHGFHRSCRWGPRRGWWHRHGPHGRPFSCGRRYYRSYYYAPSYGYAYGPAFGFRFGGHHHRHRFHGRRR